MKQKFFSILLFIVLVSGVILSCKKNSDSVMVEYRITPNIFVTSITYADKNGEDITIEGSPFVNGSKTISVDPPFMATFKAEIDPGEPTEYQMMILVNSEVVRSEYFFLLGGQTSTFVIDALVD